MFSLKSQTVNILGIPGHVVCVTATWLCCGGTSHLCLRAVPSACSAHTLDGGFRSLRGVDILGTIILCCGGPCCTVGCVAAPLTSTHQTPVNPYPHWDNNNVSRHCQMCWVGTESSLLENQSHVTGDQKHQ